MDHFHSPERIHFVKHRQRDISASMSACMRSLYSSDQWAPGFSLPVFCGRGMGGVLLSLGDFFTPAFSFNVVRDEVGLEDEFELSMQLSGTSFDSLHYSRRSLIRVTSLQRPPMTLYSISSGEYRRLRRPIT